MHKEVNLISTLTNKEFPFHTIDEFTKEGESLEVNIKNIENAKIKEGKFLWERYIDFLPFSTLNENISLGEGNTALNIANKKLKEFTGLEQLLLKNETQNPTWSFKDRGSLACIAMVKEMKENITATISTGNMGNSIAAYGAAADLKTIVFLPSYTPEEKIKAIGLHGAKIIKVFTNNYSEMKKEILKLAKKYNIRIVSGNGPIRVEGYKMIAFELFDQMNHTIPDYIAVPTSACGHIRGIFKGYKELKKAGYINKLPKMIIVQASNNSPIVQAIKQNKKNVIPFTNTKTIAKAITSGNPMGGNEIIEKAYAYNWLAEDVSEEEIVLSQKQLANSGFFVEASSATSLYAVKKLVSSGKIKKNEKVVLMLTGSGLKDIAALQNHKVDLTEVKTNDIDNILKNII